MSSTGQIELIGLSKSFDAVTAIDAIKLTIPSGTYCCLLGPSGCGKSTTLRLIAGHEIPTSGDILISNKNVTDRPPAKRGTAMMFQNYALFPHLNCLENVAFSLKMAGNKKAERSERAMEMLPNSLAGSSNVLHSPEHWLEIQIFFFWMNRFPLLTHFYEDKCELN